MTDCPRPTLFSQELANRICTEVATGRMLRDVCSADDMPTAVTVKEWLEKYPSFQTEYAAAQEQQLEQIAEEMFGIADDGSNDWMERERGDGSTVIVLNGEAIQRSKLRVELRKWWLERLQPKKFGNKVTQQHVGPEGGPIQTENISDMDIARRTLLIFSQARAQDPVRGKAMLEQLLGRELVAGE